MPLDDRREEGALQGAPEQHSTHPDNTLPGMPVASLPHWLSPSVGSIAADYIREAGLALIPIPLGLKGPRKPDWQLEANAISDAEHAAMLRNCNIGLAHAWSGTCALDVDDMTLAEPWLAARGVNVQALLNAPDACLISSGRPNRIKALYRLPRDVPRLPTIKLEGSGLELRQSAKNGTTVQDVLPPSIHPDTGEPYVWAGAGNWRSLPTLPDALLAVWIFLTKRQSNGRPSVDGGECTDDHWRRAQDVLSACPGIPADDRDVWIKVGMALHSTGRPDAYDLWVEWSQTTTRQNFDPDACEKQWDSFKAGGGITLGTLFDLAKQHGCYVPPRTVVESGMFSAIDDGAERMPMPLPDDLPDVVPFALDALPEALRPLASDVAERMQCPADFVAVPMLIAAASLVARVVAIRPQMRTDWTERANLWAMIVGRPGAMKSPAIQQALAPLEHLEKRARARYQDQLAVFQAVSLSDKLRRGAREDEAKRLLKDNSNADVTSLLTVGEAFGPPPEPRYLVNDATYEKLGVILSENPGGVLSTRDEMKSLLAHLSKEENASQRGFYVQAWSGGSYVFDRIGRGRTHIEDARLSMVGGIQPGPLSELVRQSRHGAADDGLLERFLIAWPDDPHDWRNVDRWPDSLARQIASDVFARLDTLTPDAVGAQRDSIGGGGSGPHYVRFDEAAHALFAAWRAELEARLRSSDGEGIEGALSKFRHHVPALALVSHIVDNGHGPVTEAATRKAIILAAYFESHARRCYASNRRATVRAARAILARLKSGALQDPFTVRDVHQKGWNGLSDHRTVADALDMLAAHRWLIESELTTGGRPKTLYSRPDAQ